jgi:tRNA1Val (adenine37-N6)-methyltransferase
MAVKRKTVINEIAGYENIKIFQNDECLKYSLDSILLAEFVNVKLTTKNILEIGCGNCPILLILSMRTNAKLFGIEIQKEVFKLAKKSVNINKKQNQIELINGDVKDYYKKSESDVYDIIVSNPPYNKINEYSLLNQSDKKTNARHEKLLKFEELVKISKKLLKNNASLVFIHKSERLTEIIKVLNDNNFSIKRLQFIFPKKNTNSNLVLIDATKNGKDTVKIMPPIILEN